MKTTPPEQHCLAAIEHSLSVLLSNRPQLLSELYSLSADLDLLSLRDTKLINIAAWYLAKSSSVDFCGNFWEMELSDLETFSMSLDILIEARSLYQNPPS